MPTDRYDVMVIGSGPDGGTVNPTLAIVAGALRVLAAIGRRRAV